MKKRNRRRGVLGAGVALVALVASLYGAPAFADEGRNVVLPDGVSFEGQDAKYTVYYADNTPKPEGDKDYTGFYSSLDGALAAVYISDPGAETAELYCKPGANVKASGVDTRVHVADSVTIYGNGAYMPASSEFSSIEVDHRAYKRAESAFGFNQFWFWNADESKSDLTKDITLTVKSLDGVGLWGERKTTYNINAVFEDCQNMYGILQHTNYNKPFGEQNGTTNVTVKDSSFDANNGSYDKWSILVQNGGKIDIQNTTFNGIVCPIDLNNKSVEGSELSLKDCTFTDCATKDSGYDSPISIDGKKGSETGVKIDGVEFVYSEGVEPGSDNAIQIGGAFSYPDVTLDVSNTDANIKVNGDGFHDVIDVDKTDIVTGGNSDDNPPVVTCTHPEEGKKFVDKVEPTCTEDGHEAYWTCDACGEMYSDEKFENKIDAPVAIPTPGHQPELVGAEDATCTAEGYTGDEVCSACGETVKKGEAIAKLEHSFGEWTVTVEPTANSKGLKGRTCSVCHFEEFMEIPKLDEGGSGDPKPEPGDPGDNQGGSLSDLQQQLQEAIDKATAELKQAQGQALADLEKAIEEARKALESNDKAAVEKALAKLNAALGQGVQGGSGVVSGKPGASGGSFATTGDAAPFAAAGAVAVAAAGVAAVALRKRAMR